MLMSGRAARAAAVGMVLWAGLMACAGASREPSFDEKRDRHLAELKAAGDQGRREGLLAQRRKLADGVPATAASPTRAECEQRWTDAGRKERTAGCT